MVKVLGPLIPFAETPPVISKDEHLGRIKNVTSDSDSSKKKL